MLEIPTYENIGSVSGGYRNMLGIFLKFLANCLFPNIIIGKRFRFAQIPDYNLEYSR